MSQISKCPKVTHVLTYWEASGEVSELSYKSLLFDSSKRCWVMEEWMDVCMRIQLSFTINLVLLYIPIYY